MDKYLAVFFLNIFPIINIFVIIFIAIIVVIKTPKGFDNIRFYTVAAAFFLVLSLLLAILFNTLIMGTEDSLTFSQNNTWITLLSIFFRIMGLCIAFFTILMAVQSVQNGVQGGGFTWSWFAFFLCPIWAIFNRVYLGLFSIVPFFGLVVVVYMAMFGNKIAYEKRLKREGKLT